MRRSPWRRESTIRAWCCLAVQPVDAADPQAVSDAFDRCLRMDAHERDRRAEALRQKVSRRDLVWWLNTFLRELDDAGTQDKRPRIGAVRLES